MSIIKNESAGNVELKLNNGGSCTLGPSKQVERADVTNLDDLRGKIKVTNNLTEVMNVVDKTDLSEINIRKGTAVDG